LSGRVELIACETCGASERATHGSARGERLIERLRAALASRADGLDVALSSTRCLWACQRSCAVHVRSPGRAGYVLCELEPSAASAAALLEYVAMYARSADGAVPFKQWPDALRGHFLCRIPATEETTA
jgi:predicted metal-binding protein